MNHFKGLNENERYQNELLQQIKRGNELLERIAQALQPVHEKEEKPKRTYQRRKNG